LLTLLVGLKLFDGKLASLAMTANGFVNSAICTAADESNDLVAVDDSDFTLIADMSGSPISWI
jgi:hypothetical protein